MRPSIGRIVHYVSYGTPGGEYTSQCRAAVVTEVPADDAAQHVGLAVLSPAGMFFDQDVPYDEWDNGVALEGAQPQGGSWHWPERIPEN